MKLIIVVALGLVGLFLLVILSLFLIIARNLKSMAAAVARATSLVEAVEGEKSGQLLRPMPRRSMKEIFSALPSLLKRADTLPAAVFPATTAALEKSAAAEAAAATPDPIQQSRVPGAQDETRSEFPAADDIEEAEEGARDQ